MSIQTPGKYTPRQILFVTLLALAGVLFTAAAGTGGAEALCLTRGCSLHQNVSLFGFSLWWYGAAGFAVAGTACLCKRLMLAYWLAFAGLVVDCFLLLWMAVSMPCLNCLAAALLLFGLFVALAVITRPVRRSDGPALVVSVLWLVLFSPNVFVTAQDLAGPWSIHGSGKAPVHVFFSPSCPSCRTALKGLLLDGESNLGFYPVAENEKDVQRLALLRERLRQGDSFVRAFAASRDPALAPELGLLEELGLRMGLFRNRVALARMGADRIPVIVMYGIPQGFGQHGLGGGQSGLQFGGKDGFSGCTQLGDGTEDCD